MPEYGPAVQEIAERCEIPMHRYTFKHGNNDEGETEEVVRQVYDALPKGRTFNRTEARRAVGEARLHKLKSTTRTTKIIWAPRFAYAFDHLIRIGVVERVDRGTYRCHELPDDPLAKPSRTEALRAIRTLIEKAPVDDEGRALVPRHRILCLFDAAEL